MLWLGLALGLSLLLWLGYRFLRQCEAASPADWGRRRTNCIVGFIHLFCRRVHHLRYESLPLPATGGVLVAANHMSGLDPFLLIAASPRPLRFLIAREQYQRFGLNWLFRLAFCIPVDRQGRPERALRDALRALEAGDVVALFPHGKIHLDSDPPRKLKGGVVRLAHKTGCSICPVRLDDVRGAGHTIAAVFIPSRAQLKPYPLMSCAELDQDICLKRLAELLERPQNVQSQATEN
jgi:1-acyl-sn-glycerol-3-phosphate acyltransferase